MKIRLSTRKVLISILAALSILLVALGLVSLNKSATQPVTASADETTATVSDVAGLKNALSNGGSYELITDIKLSRSDKLTIASGISVTIDLQGHSITVYNNKNAYTQYDSSSYYYGILNEGNLTIKDGSAEANGSVTGSKGGSSGEYYVTICNTGTLTVNSGTVSTSASSFARVIYNTGTLNVNGGSLECSASNLASTTYCVQNLYTAKIAKGKITGGIYNASTAELTVEDGTITATSTNAIENLGTAYISGGTITATSYDAIENLDTATISGGTISGGTYDVNSQGALTVTGGSFDSIMLVTASSTLTINNSIISDYTIYGDEKTINSGYAYKVESSGDTTVYSLEITEGSAHAYTEADDGTKTYYATISDAVSAVGTDGTQTTITALKDEDSTIKIEYGKNIVLELGDHEIYCTEDSGAAISNSGTLTINSGTISATGSSGSGINNSGTLYICGGNIGATGNNGSGINNSGTLYVYGGNITDCVIDKSNVYSIKTSSNSDTYISGGTIGSIYADGGTLSISDGYIGYINASSSNKLLKIEGGTFNEDYSSIGASYVLSLNGGVANITGGSFTGSSTGVIRVFTADVTIGSDDGDNDDIVINANGKSTYAIYVIGYSNNTISLLSGTYNGGVYLGVVQTGANINTELDVSDGTYSGAWVTHSTFNGTVALTGGTYNKAAYASITSYLAANTITEVDTDGIYTVTAYDVVFVADGTQTGLSNIDGGKTALEQALDLIISEGVEYTIILGADATLSSAWTIAENYNITLDLNGYTLSYDGTAADIKTQVRSTSSSSTNKDKTETYNYYYYYYTGIINYGVVTITDSIGTGLLQNTAASTYVSSSQDSTYTYNYYCYVGIYSKGTLTIESGTVSGTCWGIFNHSGAVNVNGGTVSGNTCAIYSLLGTIDITGGTVSGYYGINAYGTEVTMTGGVISATEWGIMVGSCTVTYADSSTGVVYASFDMTGGEITVTNNDGYSYGIYTVGKVNISGDATITAASACTEKVWVYGICVDETGSLTVSGNVVISAEYTGGNEDGGALGIGYWGMGNSTDGAEDNPVTVVINGGTIYGSTYGISGNGSYSYSDVTITGGYIEGGAAGYYHPESGTLTITGGTLIGENTAIELRAGTLTITGGTFIATSDSFDSDPNGNGTTIIGAALAISQHTTNYDISVNISGGTFSGYYAVYEEDTNTKEGDTSDNIAITITGGTYESTASGDNVTPAAVKSENVEQFILGGTYNTDVASYAAGGLSTAQNKDGTYGITLADNHKVAVFLNGSNIISAEYSDLAAAFTDINDGYIGTYGEEGAIAINGDVEIMLYADITDCGNLALTLTTYTVTLNLNGYNLTFATSGNYCEVETAVPGYTDNLNCDIYNEGTLIISNGNSNTSTITLYSSSNGIYNSQGSVTIKGDITIYYCSSSSSQCYVIYAKGGTLTLEDNVTIYNYCASELSYVIYLSYSDTGFYCYINDNVAIYNNSTSKYTIRLQSNNKGETLTINGGYFETDNTLIYVYGGAAVYINGGDFVDAGTAIYVASGTVVISGGTYNAMLDSSYFADGYYAYLQKDDSYIVDEGIPVEKPTLDVTEYVYTGADPEHGLGADGDNYTATVSANTVGVRYITIALKTGCVWADGTTDDLEIYIYIYAATITVTPPTANTFTYSGSAAEINGVSAKTADGNAATVTYYYLDGIYTDIDEIELINADTYLITYTVSADNHNDVTGSFTVTIEKATYNMSGITFSDSTVKYDTENHSIVISGDLPSGVTVEYTCEGSSLVGFAAAGTYVITATFIYDTANYNTIADMTATLTIEKIDYTVTATDYSGAYDGETHTGSVTVGNELDDKAIITYGTTAGNCTLEAAPAYKNAGTYTVYYQIKSEDSCHNDVTGYFTVTINKQEVTVSEVKQTEYDYMSEQITFITVDSGACYSAYGTTYATDAGTYTVTLVLDDTDNYTWAADTQTYYTFTINKIANEITVSMSDWTYGSAAVTPTVTITGEQGIVTYAYYSDEECKTSVDITTANAGTYYVVATVAETSNYNSAESKAVSFEITKAANSASVSITGWTYGDDANTPTVIATYGADSATIYYYTGSTAYTTEVPETAGTYYVVAVIAETTNYAGATSQATFTIAKADYDMSKVSLADIEITYGETYEIAIAGTLPEGVEVSYTGGGTAAGTYTITAIFTGDSANYNAIANITATLTINKKSVTEPTKDSTTYTYSGSAQTYGIKTNSDYTITNATHTDAGTYTVTVSLSDKSNYVWANGGTADKTFTFVINKGTVGIPAKDTATYTFTGSAQTYGVTSNAFYTVSGGVQTQSGTYTVTITLNDTANYAWSDGSTAAITYDWTINKAVQKVTAPAANNTVYVYNGSEQTYELATSTLYTISGNVQTNAGTYVVMVALTNTTDYTWSDGSITALTYTFVINNADMTVTATGYSGNYDGNAHSGSVTVKENIRYTVNYGTTSGTYTTTTAPAYKEAGIYIVYYEVSATNYNTVYGYFTVTITEATVTPSDTSTVSGSVTTDGSFVMSDVTLETTVVSSGSYNATVSAITSAVVEAVSEVEAAEVVEVYDISLTSNGSNVTVAQATGNDKGTITVSVAIPTALAGQTDFYIVHIHEGDIIGVITSDDYTIENGTVSFTVSDLSQFAFVAATDADSGLSQGEIITLCVLVGGTIAIIILLAVVLSCLNRGGKSRRRWRY